MGIEQYLDLINGVNCMITKQQRGIICKQILRKGPRCNMLVFGLGRDSIIWQTVNPGFTLFVEHDTRWSRTMEKQINGIQVLNYEYLTQCEPTLPVHEQPPISETELAAYPIPPELLARKWDIILIDGPTGFDNSCPGRMLPIYWSSVISSNRCDIFVDDYMRPIEFTHTNKFLFPRYNQFRLFDERHKMLWLKSET
ncbi:MAG: hypothetical protein ACR2QW_18165 [bacterium]